MMSMTIIIKICLSLRWAWWWCWCWWWLWWWVWGLMMRMMVDDEDDGWWWWWLICEELTTMAKGHISYKWFDGKFLLLSKYHLLFMEQQHFCKWLDSSGLAGLLGTGQSCTTILFANDPNHLMESSCKENSPYLFLHNFCNILFCRDGSPSC